MSILDHLLSSTKGFAPGVCGDRGLRCGGSWRFLVNTSPHRKDARDESVSTVNMASSDKLVSSSESDISGRKV